MSIQCGKCDSQGWDSYMIFGELYIECVSCERKIEGKFELAADGNIVQVEVSNGSH